MQIIFNDRYSEAHSEDQLFAWSSASPGYVRINSKLSGLTANTRSSEWHSFYLQHPGDTPKEWVEKGRAFVSLVNEYRKQHEQAKHDQMMSTPATERVYPIDSKKAFDFDTLINEGGEGYNPYR